MVGLTLQARFRLHWRNLIPFLASLSCAAVAYDLKQTWLIPWLVFSVLVVNYWLLSRLAMSRGEVLLARLRAMASRGRPAGEIEAAARRAWVVRAWAPEWFRLYLDGWISGRVGRPEEALDLLIQAQALAPEDRLTPILSLMAQASRAVGDVDRARALEARLVARHPELEELMDSLDSSGEQGG